MKVYANDVKRVKGVGIVHARSKHWLMEKVTQIALIPLTLWFGYNLFEMMVSPYYTVILWIVSPLTLILLGLMIPIGFLHAAGFVRIVIEDYIHTKLGKMVWFSIIYGLAYLSIAVSYVALFSLAVAS